MKKKAVASIICALSLLAVSSNAFALTPEEYENKSFEDLNLTLQGHSGNEEVNLAVIAKGDVEFGNVMGITGSVYSAGEISCEGDTNQNVIEGLLIADDIDGDEYSWGAVYDDHTSFDYSYTEFEVPDTSGFENKDTVSLDKKSNVMTINTDTHFEELTMEMNKLVIDATDAPVTIVIDRIVESTDLCFTIKGDNKVDIYINKVVDKKGKDEEEKIALFTQKELNYNNNSTSYEDILKRGNKGQTTFYLGADSALDEIAIDGNSRGCADIVCNTDLKIDGYTYFIGDIKCGGDFELTGNSALWGEVFAPESDSHIGNMAYLYGKIYTDELDISEHGYIIYQPGNNADSEDPESDKPVEPTEEPEQGEQPTEAPEQGEESEEAPPATGTEEIFDGSSQYAYIFGDAPIYITDPETNEMTVEVYMQPDRNVSRQETCAMIMRLVAQADPNMDADESDIADAVTAYDAWAAKGLGFLSSKGAYDDISYTVSGYAYPTRGEVAKLVALGLDLTLQNGALEFNDIAGNEFEEYINIMTSNGYMQGDGNGEFRPSDYMTRAEFCSMFNNVTGRTNYSLIDTDGNTITPATFYIVDLDGVDSWKVNAMMLGTSAFTDEYRVDVQTRTENIRNILDNYDGQKKY